MTHERTNDMSATTTEQSFELYYWGADEQWIAAEGHVALVAFTRAADALAKKDGNLDDDELPSVLGGGAVHQWFRPIDREWSDINSDCEMEPCAAGDEGAEAWTVIATGV